MNKQEVINEFNRLVDEGWKKAYHCLLDNNVFIGGLTEQAKLMRPDCERKSLMGAKGTQELRLMNNVGDLLTSRTVGTRWYHRFFVVEDINIETGELSIMFLDTGGKDTIPNLSIYKLVSFGKLALRKNGPQWIKSAWMMENKQ